MSRQTSTQYPHLTGQFGMMSGWSRPCPAMLVWLLILFLPLPGMAQEVGSGTLTGVVISTWDGSALSSVAVTVRGTTLATQTDASGRFELKNVPAGDQVVRFSKSGFASAVVTDVRVLPGQSTTVNGNLRPEFFDMEEYEVTAEEFTQQTEQIMLDRQQSSSMLDAIGSDQFSKLGAGDAGQIVSRVTGVSVVGGKYAVVRGLSDRYTRTLLNGVEVPSADPYRTSPQLDLFPASMIDQVGVSKTFTPDQPGGTGGGTIDITTKSFPEKPFFTVKSGTSYNPNSNLKNSFLADPKSSMAMYDLPKEPGKLNSQLQGLDKAPLPPGPASSRETPARAQARADQANAVQGLLQGLGTADFAGESKNSPLNSAAEASAGATVPVFGHNLGMFGGLNYKRNFYLIENATVNRYNANGSPDLLGEKTQGNIVTDYGANVNVGYDLSPVGQFGFNFMLANSTDQEARHSTFDHVEGRDDTLEMWQIRNTYREIQNYQVNGQHELEFLADSKVDWVVSYATTTQNEPDNRFMNYYLTPAGQPTFGDAALPTPQYPARYWRDISEDSLNYRADWTLPLAFMENDSKLKSGLWSSSTDRNFKEQYFSYNLADGFDPQNPNSYLDNPAYLQYTTQYLGGIRTNYNFQRYVGNTFSHPYTGSLDIFAGYFMEDIAVLPWLRLLGGARVEQTMMKIDVDPGASKIDQTDILPAASAVILLRTNLDLRLSYGETVGRPSFREKAPIANFLPDLNVVAFGNPELQMTHMQSYDARLEWFPAPGDVISVGVFYKQLERPIELYSLSLTDDIVTWINRTNGTANIMGIEFEARKSLEFLSAQLKGLTLGVNATFIQSETKLTSEELAAKEITDPHPSDTRPLYDQSPYIINLDLTYDHPTSGTSFSIGANLTGERIVLAKLQGPDIYEHPPITLDAVISQKFWKNWTAKFGVRNILDPEIRQTYGSSYDDKVYQSYNRGRTYGMTLTAEF